MTWCESVETGGSFLGAFGRSLPKWQTNGGNGMSWLLDADLWRFKPGN